MTPMSDLAPRLRRDYAIHRAAQLLADAVRVRAAEPALPLTLLPPEVRDWYKATARTLIEVFETMTTGREPDAVQAQREVEAAKFAQSLESRLAIERSTARVRAIARGHDLGPWSAAGPELQRGVEQAHCRRCVRAARIALGDDPVLSGLALTDGCLVAADKETV